MRRDTTGIIIGRTVRTDRTDRTVRFGITPRLPTGAIIARRLATVATTGRPIVRLSFRGSRSPSAAAVTAADPDTGLFQLPVFETSRYGGAFFLRLRAPFLSAASEIPPHIQESPGERPSGWGRAREDLRSSKRAVRVGLPLALPPPVSARPGLAPANEKSRAPASPGTRDFSNGQGGIRTHGTLTGSLL